MRLIFQTDLMNAETLVLQDSLVHSMLAFLQLHPLRESHAGDHFVSIFSRFGASGWERLLGGHKWTGRAFR